MRGAAHLHQCVWETKVQILPLNSRWIDRGQSFSSPTSVSYENYPKIAKNVIPKMRGKLWFLIFQEPTLG